MHEKTSLGGPSSSARQGARATGGSHVLILAAGFLAASLSVRAVAEEAGRPPSGRPRIVRIEIRGSASLTEGALLRELSTRKGDRYDPATLENDLHRLWKSGRYDVVRWEGPERVEGGVVLALILEERPVLRKIEFLGNKKLGTDELKAVIEKAGLFKGRRVRYDEAVAHRALTALEKRYRRDAYFLAEISYVAEAYEGADEHGLRSVKLVFDIEENEPAPLKGLRIVGNRAFTDDDIERVIFAVLSRQVDEGGTKGYDRLRFVRALNQVLWLYRDSGYLDAKVELAHLELFTHERGKGKRKQWLVTHVEITEGPLYRIGEVSLTLEPPREGPPLEVSREELLEILASPSGEFKKVHKPMKSGGVYSDTIKRQAVERLRTAFGTHGRIATDVKVRDVFGEKGTRIDLDFVIKPSRPYRVRAAHVRGNHKTREGVFLRELIYAGIRPERRDAEGNVIREASLLDSRKLDLAEKNIFYTGLVKTEYDEKTGRPRHGVKIKSVPVKGNMADLYIDVNETETGQLMMGFSMASNGEIAGQLEFRQNNFDLFGFPRSWNDWTNAFMGAGQSFSLTAYFGTITNYYSMSFVEPYFLGLPVRFELGLFDKTTRQESYDEARNGLNVSLGRTWSLHRYKRRNLRTSLRWRDESVRINVESSVDENSLIWDEAGRNRIRRAGVGITFDSIDNRLRPTSGVLVELFRDAAGGPLGGDASFTKAEFDLQAHRRIAPGIRGYPQILKFRFRANYADPYAGDTDVPFYERYYAGGVGTLRGFEYRTVGPMDPLTGDPLGGNFRVLGTLEYTFPLESSDSLRGVVFFDIGNVFQDTSDFDANELKKSAGVGLEIMPQGFPFPISMYWSWIVDHSDRDEDESQVFSFMFGNMFFF